MNIIVDTREKCPLWKGSKIINKKLDEGDYATEDTKDILTIERKAPGDLYGSILQGHDRFRRELLRSIGKHKDFYVFVECSRDDFISKKWDTAYRLRGSPGMLASIIKTLEDEYDVVFVWCSSRKEMRQKILEVIEQYRNIFIVEH